MALTIQQYYNMPGNPTRQVFPVVSFGWLRSFPIPIGPGVTQYIKEGPLLAQPVDDEWMCGANRSFDFIVGIFEQDIDNPMSLTITATIDGVIWLGVDTVLIPCSGVGGMSIVFSNYVIPAWAVRFAIYNPGPTTFSGSAMIAARSL